MAEYLDKLTDYMTHDEYNDRQYRYIAGAGNSNQFSFHNCGLRGQSDINAWILTGNRYYLERFLTVTKGINSEATVEIAVDSTAAKGAANGWSVPQTKYGATQSTYYAWEGVYFLWSHQYAMDVLNLCDRIYRHNEATSADKSDCEDIARFIWYNVCERYVTTNAGNGAHFNLEVEQMAARINRATGGERWWLDQPIILGTCCAYLEGVWATRLGIDPPDWLVPDSGTPRIDYKTWWKWWSGAGYDDTTTRYGYDVVNGQDIVEDNHAVLRHDDDANTFRDVNHFHRAPAFAFALRQNAVLTNQDSKDRLNRLLAAYAGNCAKFITTTDEGYAHTTWYADGRDPTTTPNNVSASRKPFTTWGTFCIEDDYIAGLFQTLVDAADLSESHPGYLDGYSRNHHESYANVCSWVAMHEAGITKAEVYDNWDQAFDISGLDITWKTARNRVNRPVLKIAKDSEDITVHNASGDHQGFSGSLLSILDGDTNDYYVVDMATFEVQTVGNRNPTGGNVNENFIWTETEREYYILADGGYLKRINYDTGEVWSVSLPASVTGASGYGSITPQWRFQGGSGDSSPWLVCYDSVNGFNGIQSFDKDDGSLGTLFWFRDLSGADAATDTGENIQSRMGGWVYKATDDDPHVHMWTDGTNAVEIEPEEEANTLNDSSHPAFVDYTEVSTWNDVLGSDPGGIQQIRVYTHSNPPTLDGRTARFTMDKTAPMALVDSSNSNGLAWHHGYAYLDSSGNEKAYAALIHTTAEDCLIGILDLVDDTQDFTTLEVVDYDTTGGLFLQYARPTGNDDYYAYHQSSTGTSGGDAVVYVSFPTAVVGTINLPADETEEDNDETEDIEEEESSEIDETDGNIPGGDADEAEDDAEAADPLWATLKAELALQVDQKWLDNESRDRPGTLVFWVTAGITDIGEWETGDMKEVAARIEQHKDDLKTSGTNTINYDYTVNVPEDIAVGSLVYFGSSTDLETSGTFQICEVVDFEKVPDLKGRKYDRHIKAKKFTNAEIEIETLVHNEEEVEHNEVDVSHGSSITF